VVVLLALGSALAYGLSDFAGGLLARRISPWAVAVVAQSAATVLTFLLALAVAGEPTTSHWVWSALAGVGSGAGAAFLYRGLGAGRMGVVAPISAVGAALLPVVFGVALGERPSMLTWLGVLCAGPAIWLVSRVDTGERRDHTDSTDRAAPTPSGVVDGVLAGIGFGLLFTALGQVPEDAGLGPLTLTQGVSVLATILLAVALRTPWVPRGRVSLLGVVPGVLGTAATVLFLLATQTGLLTVAAVVTSLYPALTVLLAALVLRERIGHTQGVGLGLAAACVALVAAG
jgi:drug/metabolite transporter (DMT)-like permease